MPIVRTYQCPRCNHRMSVTLRMEQCDQAAPKCPSCAARRMQQEFKPPGIVGSSAAKARSLSEDILARDYNVADVKFSKYEGDKNKVRYKDAGNTGTSQTSSWVANRETIEGAIAMGRQQRMDYGGSPLDMLQANIKSGAEPDLIEITKRRSIKVW